MKLHYYQETDSLYIDLSERTSVDSREVAPGVVADFDAEGRIVGFDIDRASQVADLKVVKTVRLPIKRKRASAKRTQIPEIPSELAAALTQIPAGYKLRYDKSGKARMVKERAKPLR